MITDTVVDSREARDSELRTVCKLVMEGLGYRVRLARAMDFVSIGMILSLMLAKEALAVVELPTLHRLRDFGMPMRAVEWVGNSGFKESLNLLDRSILIVCLIEYPCKKRVKASNHSGGL
jgi:hypothetical protein